MADEIIQWASLLIVVPLGIVWVAALISAGRGFARDMRRRFR